MRVMQSINHQHGLTYKEDPHSDETLRLFALGLAVETLEIRHILKRITRESRKRTSTASIP
jgi:hypothetical protein